MKLTYSHCVKYTHGQLDREPWSKYEKRRVDFIIKCWPATIDNDKEEYQIVISGKPASGCYIDLGEALDEAKYFLMANSRDSAEIESIHSLVPIICPRCGKQPDPYPLEPWQSLKSGIQCNWCQYFIPSEVVKARLSI